jgi:hypothetical protein
VQAKRRISGGKTIGYEGLSGIEQIRRTGVCTRVKISKVYVEMKGKVRLGECD